MGDQKARAQRQLAADLDLQPEITRLTFHMFAPVAFVSAVGIVGATVLLARHYQDSWLWHLAWWMTIVCSFRIALPIAFKRRPNPHLTLASARRWQWAHAIGTCLTCCNLALSTLHNFKYHDHAAQFICTVGIFIFCTGIGASFGIRPWIAQLCGCITMGSLARALFFTQDPMLYRVGCTLIFLFALVYFKLVVEKYRMVVEQLRLKRQMSDLAEHDALTGLANRRQFQGRLNQICGQPGAFAVLFMDLDGFKRVNDTHGHATGDALLLQVARRLQAAVRGDDLLARLGGDEFAILHLASATRASAQALAVHLNEVVSEPYEIDGHDIRIGTSIGIQLASAADSDPNRLLSRADAALYRVKQAGGGSFRFHDEDSEIKMILPEGVQPAQSAVPAQAAEVTSGPGQDLAHGVRKILVGASQ